MTSISHVKSNPEQSGTRHRLSGYSTVSLSALCAAYVQGPLTKIFDFNGTLAEMDHFGLTQPLFSQSLSSSSN